MITCFGSPSYACASCIMIMEAGSRLIILFNSDILPYSDLSSSYFPPFFVLAPPFPIPIQQRRRRWQQREICQCLIVWTKHLHHPRRSPIPFGWVVCCLRAYTLLSGCIAHLDVDRCRCDDSSVDHTVRSPLPPSLR